MLHVLVLMNYRLIRRLNLSHIRRLVGQLLVDLPKLLLAVVLFVILLNMLQLFLGGKLLSSDAFGLFLFGNTLLDKLDLLVQLFLGGKRFEQL